jgi:hypothetical protein
LAGDVCSWYCWIALDSRQTVFQYPSLITKRQPGYQKMFMEQPTMPNRNFLPFFLFALVSASAMR